MLFEEQIIHNKRTSLLLIFIFIVFVSSIGFVFGFAIGKSPGAGYVGIGAAFTIAVIMTAVAYWGGKDVIMGVSRAKKVDKRFNQQLFNIVEEMAIASGQPVPEIYVINDSAPNAFATGRDPRHSAIGVTTGLLDKLDRDELSGVVGHEMAHIKNYDIRYMLLAGILVGVVALMSDFMLRYFWHGGLMRGRRSNSSKGGGAVQLVMLVLALVLAVLAPLFALILQFAVSRKREYLADASSVQFTRNPEGLAKALEKISGDTDPLEAANRATQHLYIVNPLKARGGYERSSIFSTHPPISERIRRLREM
ncbi:MAG: M48 family metallopeptidase [Planctomycetota bacterium]